MFNPRSISELVSLYELMPFGLFLWAAATQSPFLAILAVATLSKMLPEKLMKRFVPFPKGIRARPKKASNCNALNKGGSYEDKPGFPSGHTTTAWFIFTYCVLQYQKHPKLFGPVWVTSLYALAVPIARIALSCHTPTQIAGGMVLGTLWAFGFVQLENRVLDKQSWYKADKERIVAWFSSDSYAFATQKHMSRFFILGLVSITLMASMVTQRYAPGW